MTSASIISHDKKIGIILNFEGAKSRPIVECSRKNESPPRIRNQLSFKTKRSFPSKIAVAAGEFGLGRGALGGGFALGGQWGAPGGG